MNIQTVNVTTEIHSASNAHLQKSPINQYKNTGCKNEPAINAFCKDFSYLLYTCNSS